MGTMLAVVAMGNMPTHLGNMRLFEGAWIWRVALIAYIYLFFCVMDQRKFGRTNWIFVWSR